MCKCRARRIARRCGMDNGHGEAWQFPETLWTNSAERAEVRPQNQYALKTAHERKDGEMSAARRAEDAESLTRPEIL